MHKEDIIEEVLNNGINSTIDKYGLTKDKVIEIVKPFTDEIDSATTCCKCKSIHTKKDEIFICHSEWCSPYRLCK